MDLERRRLVLCRRDGVIQKNMWKWIDGECYYFDSTGNMAVDTWIDGCYVNSSGAWVY